MKAAVHLSESETSGTQSHLQQSFWEYKTETLMVVEAGRGVAGERFAFNATSQPTAGYSVVYTSLPTPRLTIPIIGVRRKGRDRPSYKVIEVPVKPLLRVRRARARARVCISTPLVPLLCPSWAGCQSTAFDILCTARRAHQIIRASGHVHAAGQHKSYRSSVLWGR